MEEPNYNLEEHNQIGEPNQQEPESGLSPASGSRWFGRGIYGSKDVPIRLLDGLIIAILGTILLLTVLFSMNGGYRVTFNTNGGNEIAWQKLRYGKMAEEPEIPMKPGYLFDGWYLDGDAEQPWNFAVDTVGSDLTLVAKWMAAPILIRFELDGGTYMGKEQIEPIEVIYEDVYGELPTPEQEGYVFDGWVYSGKQIGKDTPVQMPGEHVLTAQWK